MSRHRRQAGFTLIELMIVVVIIALLAMVAYPSFAQQIAKSRRSDAKSALLACAQTLERYSTQSGNYAAGSDASVAAACVGSSKAGYYTLPTSNVPQTVGATAFVITAVPAGQQSGDACGSYTYDQNGVKGVSGGSLPSTSCW